MGSHVTKWNGVELCLGFPVRFSEGHPVLNELDAQKSLEPVLAPPLRLTTPHPTIVIDPGHGGNQAGTKSTLYNRFEKEFTLDWAKRLAALLKLQGWNVVLTRFGDEAVPLTNRVAVAELARANIFLSLHFNSSFPRTDQSGIETYCMTPTGMPSNLTRGYEDDPRLVTPNNSFDRENLQLAMLLHRAILEGAHPADRGVRHARFMDVLKGQNRPAVLIEGGYLSNPEEAELIGTPAYRQRLAASVASALETLLPGNQTSVTQR
jgi:N-acetylmuramoyl-L-alanine amidase